VALDHDANVRSAEFVLWAMTFSSRMPRDVRILPGGGGGNLDPSVAPAGSGRGHTSSTVGLQDTTTCINATRKFAYPPLALPRREYMERALQRWHAAGLPQATLQQPWHGYTLGFWPDELVGYARQVIQGRFPEVVDHPVPPSAPQEAPTAPM
jgi:4-hydroxy-3-polyprenylbenzoate decarboxylase